MTVPMSVYSESFIPAEPWRVEAACTQVDPDLFFPTKGDAERPVRSVRDAL